jgi:hypothetical protein
LKLLGRTGRRRCSRQKDHSFRPNFAYFLSEAAEKT